MSSILKEALIFYRWDTFSKHTVRKSVWIGNDENLIELKIAEEFYDHITSNPDYLNYRMSDVIIAALTAFVPCWIAKEVSFLIGRKSFTRLFLDSFSTHVDIVQKDLYHDRNSTLFETAKIQTAYELHCLTAGPNTARHTSTSRTELEANKLTSLILNDNEILAELGLTKDTVTSEVTALP
jgi:hypothetical protein